MLFLLQTKIVILIKIIKRVYISIILISIYPKKLSPCKIHIIHLLISSKKLEMISDTNYDEIDNKIRKFFNEKDLFRGCSWMESNISGIKEKEKNSLYDRSTTFLTDKSRSMVSYIADKETKALNINFAGNFHSSYPNNNDLINFRSEINELGNDFIPSELENIDSCSSIAKSDNEIYKSLNRMRTPMPRIKNEDFLYLEFNGMKVDFKEPIIINSFIFRGDKITSDVWEYFDRNLDNLLPDKPTTKAMFSLHETDENSYFVVTLNRVVMDDNGAVINNCIKNKKEKEFEEIKNKFWPRFNDMYTSFALAAVPLTKLIESSALGTGLIIDKFYFGEIGKVYNGSFIKAQIERSIRRSESYNCSISYKAKRMSDLSPSSFGDDVAIINSIVSVPPVPFQRCTNELIITINEVSFDHSKLKTKAKNVFAEISVENSNGKRIKCIRSRYSHSEFVETYKTRVICKNKLPQFADQVRIDLSRSLFSKEGDPSCKLIITFNNVLFDNSGLLYVPVAKLCFPLSENLALLIKNEPFKVGIDHVLPLHLQEYSTQVSNSYVELSPYVRSVLLTFGPLSEFFDGKLNVDLEDIEDGVITSHLFLILDRLINTKVVYCDNVIRLLSQIFPKVRDKDLFQYYAVKYAFRSTFDDQFHSKALKALTEYILRDKNESSELGHILRFLFILINKALLIKSHKLSSYQSDLGGFVNAMVNKYSFTKGKSMGLTRSEEMIQLLAYLVTLFTESELYSSAALIVLSLCRYYISNYNKEEWSPSSGSVICRFFDHALSPRLFIGASLYNLDFTSSLISILEIAAYKPSSEPIGVIFTIFVRCLSFTPVEVAPFIADHYCILLCKMIISEEHDQNSLCDKIAITSFLLRNLSKERTEELMSKSYSVERLFNNKDGLITMALKKGKYDKNLVFSPRKQYFSSVDSYYSHQSLQSSSESNVRMFKKTKDWHDSHKSDNSYDPLKELAYDCSNSVLIFISSCIKVDVDLVSRIMFTFFQILSMNFPLSCTNLIVDTFSEFFKKFTKKIVENIDPPFMLLIKKITQLIFCKNVFVSSAFTSLLPVIFECEKAKYRNNNRSLMAIIYSTSLIKDLQPTLHEYRGVTEMFKKYRKDSKNCPFGELVNFIEHFVDINNRIKKHLKTSNKSETLTPEMMLIELHRTDFNKPLAPNGIDVLANFIWEIILLYQRSPDAQLQTITKLGNLYSANSYFSECIYTKYLSCALICYHMELLNRSTDKIENPIQVSKLLHTSDTLKRDLPDIPGYCDVLNFSNAKLYRLAEEVVDICNRERVYEFVFQLLRSLEPMFCGEVNGRLNEERIKMLEKLKQITKEEERLLGRYYRVSFYGKEFGDDNMQTYIYRELKLTNLYQFQAQIEQFYSQRIPNKKVEIIRESTPITSSSILDFKRKCYIQVTFVNTIFPDDDKSARDTIFEKYTNVSQFYFEIPFIRDVTDKSNGDDPSNVKTKQGTVENQWLRRTVLTTEYPMPSIFKRVKVIKIETLDIEPIVFWTTTVAKKVEELRVSVISENVSQIQPLLNGILLVQVNDGPLKLAEVHLKDKPNTSNTVAMKEQFKILLEFLERGIATTRKSIDGNSNPNARDLQKEIETSFKAFKNDMEPYLAY